MSWPPTPWDSCSTAAGDPGGAGGLGRRRPCVQLLNESGLELNRGGSSSYSANLLVKDDPSIFALGDCATLMPEGAERPLPPTAQVANQQALHLIRHLPAWLRKGESVPPFRFRDLGALVALSDYNAFGSWAALGSSKDASSRATSRG